MLLCGSIQTLEAQDAKTKADTFLNFKELRPGLCVTIGDTDGDLLAEIAADGKYHVHALTPDQANVEILRESIASKGLYGQVTVDHSLFTSLPYTNNLINVLIVNDFVALKKKGLTVKELMRAVAPKNSMLIRNAPADLKQIITQAGYKDAVINRQGIWTQIIKPWPEAMDEWPQHHHDSGLSRTSGDQLAGPPDSVQWIAGDPWRHEAGPQSFITANGRVFSASTREGIIARDAFNGLQLWHRKSVPFGGGSVPSCWIAEDDQLFTVLERGGPLVALDAATGKTIRTYDFSPGRIAYQDGILLAIDRDENVQAHDAKSGEKLWEKRINGLSDRSIDLLNMKSFDPVSTGRIILGDGKVFLTIPKPREFLCLDLRSGEELWRTAGEDESLAFFKHGTLFSAGRIGRSQVFNAAYSPKDGKLLWRYDYTAVYHGGHPFNIFYLEELVWIHTYGPSGKKGEGQVWNGLNPKTGEVARTLNYERTNHRCFADRATEQYVMSGGMEFLDVKNGEQNKFRGGRGNCDNGFTPANGFIYTHPNVCVCSSQVRGFVAFGSNASSTNRKDEPQNTEVLQTGAGKPADETPSPEDWPMLRHDPGRSGSTKAVVPADLKNVWKKESGSGLSSPVIAAGKVYVSSIDDHRVIALDLKTGNEVWNYRANGRVDSPPTIYAGTAIFGCSDGWVYCVSSATGELIWRRLAAPQQRWLVSQGQVESAWPVHGSVLVDNDTAYFAAGRQTEVDNGIILYAASPKTGEILWRKQLYIPQGSLWGGGSNANHILVSGGQTITMDNAMFDSETGSSKGEWRTSTQGQTDFFWAGPNGFLADIARPAAGWHELNHRKWTFSSAGTYQDHTGGLILAFSNQNVFGVRIAGRNAWKDEVTSYELFSSSKNEGRNHPFWNVPIQKGYYPKSILSAGGKLYVAAESPEDDDKSKGVIFIYDAKDGKSLDTIPLNVKPRFDGLAAVNGSLIVVGQDGKVTRLAKE